MYAKRILLLLLLSMCSRHYALAQGKGMSMVSLSEGIVTSAELNGVTSTSYMDIPTSATGAFFLTYRYFFTNRFAIGVSAGVDNVKGPLTEGNPNVNGGQDGTVGTYIRNSATIAPEFFVKYFRHGRVMIYGYAGIGYTFAKLEKAYNPQVYASSYQNGVNTSYGLPPYLSSENPVYANQGHINGQFTPFGLRIGNMIAWDLELGFGYKGLINTGLSYVFKY
jgi:hypothetical protein